MEPVAASAAITGTDFLYALVALLVALSVASERLVEIIKGAIPSLNKENPDTTREGWRRAAIQSLAVICGIGTAFFAHPALAKVLPQPWDNKATYLALGFLTSGGSGFWNGILGYVQNVKDIKGGLAEKTKESAKPSGGR